MSGKIIALIAAVFFVFGMGKLSFAMSCGAHGQHQQTAQAGHEEHQSESVAETAPQAVDAGNKICPVSGEKIDEKLKATYEYEGKIYNFCCPMCIDEFKKDPQKYINKVEEELKSGREKGSPPEAMREGEGY